MSKRAREDDGAGAEDAATTTAAGDDGTGAEDDGAGTSGDSTFDVVQGRPYSVLPFGVGEHLSPALPSRNGHTIVHVNLKGGQRFLVEFCPESAETFNLYLKTPDGRIESRLPGMTLQFRYSPLDGGITHISEMPKISPIPPNGEFKYYRIRNPTYIEGLTCGCSRSEENLGAARAVVREKYKDLRLAFAAPRARGDEAKTASDVVQATLALQAAEDACIRANQTRCPLLWCFTVKVKNLTGLGLEG